MGALLMKHLYRSHWYNVERIQLIRVVLSRCVLASESR